MTEYYRKSYIIGDQCYIYVVDHGVGRLFSVDDDGQALLLADNIKTSGKAINIDDEFMSAINS